MRFAASTIALLLAISSGATAFSPSCRAGGAASLPIRMSAMDPNNIRMGVPLSGGGGGVGGGGGTTTATSLSVATISAPETTSEIETEEDEARSAAELPRQRQRQRREEARAAKSYLDDGFVFGLEGSGIERPRGKNPNLVIEGDSLETRPHQVAAVAATFLGHAYFMSSSISQLLTLSGGDVAVAAVQSLALIASSWVLADLGSGVLHWSVDNYGNGRTPVMGGIIAAFQGHHSAPWTITYRGFCNNVCKLCVPFGIPTVVGINALAGPSHPEVTLFFSVFCAMEILSQEFHKWSHMTKGQCPTWVNTLQDLGLTIGRKPHALHHQAPYDGNYCIISGICNDPLDRSGFFRWLEHRVYEWNGVESNAWKLDPELRARTLRGEYGLPE